jgi:hypothetical protein
MVICNNKISFKFFLILFLIIIFTFNSKAEASFKKIENKTVSYLDFFLLKLENKLTRRTQYLSGQIIATRVQYSNVGIKINYNKEKEKIFVDIYSIMDKKRYSKKKYLPKLSDCNQVRNLIFYRSTGYTFFTQKRDPKLSESIMEDIFREVFFESSSLNKNEIKFLLDNMFINVSILHPIKKIEVTCSGKINEYELK